MDVIEGDGMKICKAVRVILFLAAILATAVSCVNAECTACKSGSVTAQQDSLNKEWAAFLGTDNATTEEVTTSTSATGLISPQYSRQNNPALKEEGSDRSSSILVPLDNVGDSEIILDISPDPAEYIPGAIGIPYTDFLLPGGALKTVSEMSEVLSKAGISENDSVLIYGECQPCGGGPSAATYVYWILKYLGHKEVKLLDGSIDDWVTAGKPTASSSSYLPSKNYTSTLNSGLLASYEYVRSGSAQVIDARTATEFKAGSIPGSINIPYNQVLDGKRIKDEAALRELFSSLDPNKPIVVYTNTGIKASMIWLALTLLDYDARVYSWMDWQANLPHLNIDLQEAHGDPNPAKIGDAVTMTVVFQEKNNSSEGTIKIGSSSQAEKSAAGSGFTASALIKSPSGEQVSDVVLKRIRSDGDEFTSIWNANVASGVYSVDIVATLDEVTETFRDAMRIEVAGTSKYKNIGNE